MGKPLPIGTVAFLFTDIQDSTPMWERTSEKMAEALQIHNTALRRVIEAHGGAVFKIVGCSFQAVFHPAMLDIKRRAQGKGRKIGKTRIQPCNPCFSAIQIVPSAFSFI
jgi:hypothetical protein